MPTLKTLASRSQRLARQDKARQNARYSTRRCWLRELVSRHMLTNRDLAQVLDVTPHTVGSWLMQPTAHGWQPIVCVRERQIRSMVPDHSPMLPETLATLAWPPVHRAAYRDYFAQDVPQITARQLREWRVEHHVTQGVLATLLGVGQATIATWERGRNIPSIQQKNIWWLMKNGVNIH